MSGCLEAVQSRGGLEGSGASFGYHGHLLASKKASVEGIP